MKNIIKNVWRWLRTDGLLHVETSALIMLVIKRFIGLVGGPAPLAFAAVITLLIGIFKEIYDRASGSGCAEWHDVICDIAGIVLAVLL